MKYNKPPKFKDVAVKNWFVLGILICIFLATIYPSLGAKQGPLKPEVTVKYGATSLIFFISGLFLKINKFFQILKRYKLHLFIQVFTFTVIPFIIITFNNFLKIFGVNEWILKGLITVACMPPPVSSAVILTRASQGNEAAAIFNSILGSFLGIIITPIALYLTLGSTTIVPFVSTIIQLVLTVLIPLVIGVGIKKFFSFQSFHTLLSIIGKCALLFIIYTTFCDMFLSHELGFSATDILITVLLVMIIQILLMYLSYILAQSMNYYFSPADVIAIMFCSTHKSLTLGVPILRIMFHGYSHLSQITLPLLVYHPMQIILGGLLTSQLEEWVQKVKLKRFPV